jgi:hypothetical protein
MVGLSWPVVAWEPRRAQSQTTPDEVALLANPCERGHFLCRTSSGPQDGMVGISP